MTRLPPVLGKTLALAILFALLGGIYWFAMEPIINRYAQLDDAIATQSDLLQRYRALGLSRDSLQKKLTEISDKDTAKTGTLPGKSESLGARHRVAPAAKAMTNSQMAASKLSEEN